MTRILALTSLLLPLALIATPLSSQAHDHRKHHSKREHKEEFWDGHCKVERQWKNNGEYKEKRKCKNRSAPHPVYMTPPPPAYVAPSPQGLVIDSRIVIKP